MAVMLGATMAGAVLIAVALLRSPLGRAIRLGLDCFAEASRKEPGALG